jgi:Raf kinase inhibitor-like YbhB/YbcL family protein
MPGTGAVPWIRAGTTAAVLVVAGRALPAADFQLDSTAVAPNGTLARQQVYNEFGCNGENVSPSLRWTGAPSGTKSFAVTVYDPDAAHSGWWHWAVYDIPAAVTALAPGAGNPGGSLPQGAVQARTDFGTAAYGGPCPPPHDKPHHYVFTVYALATERLGLPAGADARQVGEAAKAHSLAAANFTALYGR